MSAHELVNGIKFYLFMQNEEVLKKCAQDYLARVKQEEQRYQTLKLHAEEKLDKYEKSGQQKSLGEKLYLDKNTYYFSSFLQGQ